MRALFPQFCSLIGLLAFLNQLMNQAPLEKSIFIGMGAGFAIYLVLLIGDLTIQHILEHIPEPEAATEAQEGLGTEAGTSSEEASKLNLVDDQKEALAA